MNTARLNTAYTAGEFARRLKDLKDEAAQYYGKDSREYNAFLTLLEHDAQGCVTRQVSALNETVRRVQREVVDWLALASVTPSVPRG